MLKRNYQFNLLQKKYFMLLALFLSSLGTYAQTNTVTGLVKSDVDGEPIPGVSILISGTTQGAITDFEGKFKINVDPSKFLEFTAIGFKDERIKVGRQKIIVLNMEEDIKALNEVIVIGYGEQNVKEISGAVNHVKSEELTKIATADIGTALQGQIAGVNIQASSGAPGATSNIQIRGVSSIIGSSEPLFVVDGIPQDTDPRLSNNEIESIDVLKDAASAAIYGTRGAGGVILITTKKGKAGTMRVGMDSYYGIQKITSGIELMNFEDFLYNYMTYQQMNNDQFNMDQIWTPMQMNLNNYTNNSNIMDVIQNDGASIQNHSINISGGKDDLTFSLVGSMFFQDGILVNSSYDRYNLRSNINYTKGRMKMNIGLGMRIEEQENAPWGLLYEAYRYRPYQDMIDPSAGESTGSDADADAVIFGNITYKLKQEDVRKGEQLNANYNLSYTLFKGFNLTSRLGARYTNNTRNTFNPPFVIYKSDGSVFEHPSFRSRIRNTSDRGTGFTLETGFNYTKKINGHNFKLLGVFSTEKYAFSQFWAEKKDIISDDVPIIGGGTTEPNAGSGTHWNQNKVNTLVGMIGRFQYDYKGRYLLSASIRKDGSSRFSKEHRWGVFPSISTAWNVADEKFWEPLKSSIKTFKIRASYGSTGNQNFLDYSNAPIITLGHDYPFGPDNNGGLKLGMIQETYANAEVRWETSEQINIGVNLGFFDNRLNLTGDLYQTNKKDMLFPTLTPPTTGAGQNSTVILNAGNMTNNGVELALGWRNVGAVTWSINGTFTKNINRVTNMAGFTDISYFNDGYPVNVSGNQDRITAIKEGYEAGSFFVMKTNGIIKSEEVLEAYKELDPNARMGDLIYVDTDGDGKITEDDRVYGGSGMPDFELGFNTSIEWKGFDFSMMWYASVGNEVINGSRLYSFMYGTHQDLLDQYTPQHPEGIYPTARGNSHMNYRGWADIWIEDGSFVRLRNITFGYTIPRNILTKIGLKSLRVYVASDNPITITKYRGYNPEIGGNGLATRGIDRGNFPVASQFRGGVQLNF
ncbi:TonB-dependent receptor [Persicobacter psychrovividus]|uniref:SusC/RagA family TonB-linked outer membrane protein n=1 Tax=Persicobacter psychrovividus TaxID=387638 RepID=A0ABN6LGM9_9BACT|nr:SusC/RagA family TonB-linked outer membrane protein [Persicobacter psychrovividus]